MAIEPAGVPHARQVRRSPITPPEVEWELERLGVELEETTERYETAITDAASAEADFKIAHAKALLRAKGTVAERNAWADFSCEAEMRDHLLKSAIVKGIRERLAALHANMEKARSLNTNVRGQAGLNQ